MKRRPAWKGFFNVNSCGVVALWLCTAQAQRAQALHAIAVAEYQLFNAEDGSVVSSVDGASPTNGGAGVGDGDGDGDGDVSALSADDAASPAHVDDAPGDDGDAQQQQAATRIQAQARKRAAAKRVKALKAKQVADLKAAKREAQRVVQASDLMLETLSSARSEDSSIPFHAEVLDIGAPQGPLLPMLLRLTAPQQSPWKRQPSVEAERVESPGAGSAVTCGFRVFGGAAVGLFSLSLWSRSSRCCCCCLGFLGGFFSPCTARLSLPQPVLLCLNSDVC